MKRYTTMTDRAEIIALRQQGQSYEQIAERTGWSREVIGKIWRAYQSDPTQVPPPQALGRPQQGILSSFDPLVRFATLRLKCQHPHWGPDVILAELRKQPWSQGEPLPSASSLSDYFQQFGERLIRVRPHKQLPQAAPLAPALRLAHGCWQLDMVERLELPGYGPANLLDIVDAFTGVKIAAQLFPAKQQGHYCHVSWPQMQETLRGAFRRWGLPYRLRTDHDRIIVAEGEYPFPKLFTLWLVGLGIEHELIRRVTQNGGVERTHQTWQGRLSGYGPFAALNEWQALLDYERWRMNAVLPSRGRHCQRRPPLSVYPTAQTPVRWYRPGDEWALFDLQRIYTYLDAGSWLRKCCDRGTFALNSQHFTLGRRYGNQVVQIRHAVANHFFVTCPPDSTVLRVFPLKGLTSADIVGPISEV